MSLSKRRKVDTECRVFNEKGTVNYFFTKTNTKPVCLSCFHQIAAVKEYNIWGHYETHHTEQYGNLKGQIRKDEIRKRLGGLQKTTVYFSLN